MPPLCAKVAEDHGASALFVHGRTRDQVYKGFADWDVICDVKKSVEIPVIGNGDIENADQAVSRLKESGCDGIMIGRASLKNPWIFQETKALLGKQTAGQKKDLQWFLTEYVSRMKPREKESTIIFRIRNLAAQMSRGTKNSTRFRAHLFSLTDLEDVLETTERYFNS
jgi:tRNA-dihydrouridine synthase B